MPQPIYAPDPLEGVTKFLIQQQAMKQQNEIANEQISIRKKELQQQAAEFQFEQQKQQAAQAQAQGPQLAQQQALQQMLGQAAQPMGGVGPIANVPQGNIDPSLQPAVDYANLSRQPGVTRDQALAAAPEYLKRVQQAKVERETSQYLTQLRGSLTPDEFTKFNAAVNLKMRLGDAVPNDYLAFAIPETAMQAAQRLKTKAEARAISNKADSDEYAKKRLKEDYGIDVGVDDANKTLDSMILADRTAKQARALAEYNQGQENRRAQVGTTKDLRDNFDKSDILKRTQLIASSYGKIRKAASMPNPSGASDTGMVYAFINMQDQTAAREGEQKLLSKAMSPAEKLKLYTGIEHWTVGAKFTPTQRNLVLQAAEQQLAAQQESFNTYRNWYRDLASKSGINPDDVTYDPVADVRRQADAQNASTTDRRIREARGLRRP